MPNKIDPMEIRFQIDGHDVVAPEGSTVLAAAREYGIHIPTLCYHPALRPSGTCKMCAVEVENIGGRTLTMLSCVLKVKAHMVIRTSSDAVHQARAKALKRLVAMAPQAPRLQQMAIEEDITLPPAPDGCIRCRLCVRVCKEIVGQEALRMEKRAGRLEVAVHPGRCIGCGTCANLCPTHAIHVIDQGSLRTVRKDEVIFGQHPLERCQGCGKYYATEKQVDLAEKRTEPHTQVKLHHHYCPTCAKLFSDRLQVLKKQPPKHRFTIT